MLEPLNTPLLVESEPSSCSERLAQTLRRRIDNGEWSQGARLDSVRTLARKEGLSVTTVLKAVDHLVSDGYLRKIYRKGIYVASTARPARSKTRKVGILVPFSLRRPIAQTSLVLDEAVGAFHQIVLAGDCLISMHHCHCADEQCGRRYLQVKELAAYGLDAIFTVGIYDFAYLADLARMKRPLVAFDVDATHVALDSVFPENRAAAFALTRTFLEAGHRAIAYLGGPLPIPGADNEGRYDPSALERAQGYELAMHALAPGQPAIARHHEGRRGGEELAAAAVQLLREHPECTAIVSEGAFDASKLAGRRVDVACFAPAGAKDFPEGVCAVAEFDFAEMGRCAAELLLQRIKDPGAPVRRAAIPGVIRRLEGAQSLRRVSWQGGVS